MGTGYPFIRIIGLYCPLRKRILTECCARPLNWHQDPVRSVTKNLMYSCCVQVLVVIKLRIIYASSLWRSVMRHLVIATATAIISAGAILSVADAADLYTTPPPPAAEAPPPAGIAPPPVAVIPEAPIVVEPRCPTVWRCGYWGCGWRAACAPVTAEVYGVAPYWRHRFPYREYRRPYWGYSHPWGHWRHWEG